MSLSIFARGLSVMAIIFAIYGWLLRPDVPHIPLSIIFVAILTYVVFSLDFRHVRRYAGGTPTKEHRMPTRTAAGRTIIFASSVNLDEDTNAVADTYVFEDTREVAGTVTVFPSGNTAFNVKGQPIVKTGTRDFMDALMGLAAAL